MGTAVNPLLLAAIYEEQKGATDAEYRESSMLL
jgi:hypothetical protein